MRSVRNFIRQSLLPKTIAAILAVLCSAGCGGNQSAPNPGSEPATMPIPHGPCDGITCSGHGSCAVLNGSAICSCNSGYHAEGLSCEPICTPSCGSRVCGGDDGCGNSCGTCPSSYTCSAAGQCVAPLPPPGTATLKVDNSSSTTLSYLYIRLSGMDDWGPDQLGSRVIASGSNFTITNIPCPNNYDLKVENLSRTVGAQRFNVPFPCGSTFTWTLK